MLKSRSITGSDARHQSPDMILGFAEYALLFPIYICLSFSVSLHFRQSLLYDSQFNIYICTRLSSTGYEPAAFCSLESTSTSFIISEAPPAIKVLYLTLSFEVRHIEFCWNRCLLLVLVYHLSSALCSRGSSRHLLVFVYRFSTAFCCIGLNRCLMIVPASILKLHSLQNHRTPAKSIGLTACPLFIGFTACPLFIGLTPCPLNFSSRLRLLYRPCAVLTPLISCVGGVSTTSPRADTSSSATPPAEYRSTTPGCLEQLRSVEYCPTSNCMTTVSPRVNYLLMSTTPAPVIFVSTTRSCRLSILASATHYINTFWKYRVLFKISSMSRLWTADTWAMSANAQLCDSGQWTSRDRQWQFGP